MRVVLMANKLQLNTNGVYRVVDNKGLIEVCEGHMILYASDHQSIADKVKAAGIEDNLEGQRVMFGLMFLDVEMP